MRLDPRDALGRAVEIARIIDRDVRAMRGRADRDRPADPRGGTSDDDGLSFNSFTALLLILSTGSPWPSGFEKQPIDARKSQQLASYSIK
jgi:hypothetical protein